MAKRADGEGSIYKVGDKYRGSLRLEGKKRKYFTGRTKAEVSEKIEAAREAVAQGISITDPSQTLSEYLHRWLAADKKHSVRPSTYDYYARQVERAERHIGTVKLDQLKVAHIQHCYAALLEEGYAPRCVEMVHSVLRMALRRAVQWDLISRSPVQLVKPPRPTPKEMQTLSPAEVHIFFEHTKDDRLHGLWVVLLTTGLRIGEAMALRWDDIDLETGSLTVRRTVQRLKGRGLVVGEPKTARSRRTVYLSAGSIVALKLHEARQKIERRNARDLWQDRNLVFCTEVGGFTDPAGINLALHRRLKAAGLPKLRVHDLRHTAATYLLSLGVHPKVVQDMLGHSSIAQTLDTYSHMVPALHREVALHMDRLFSAPMDAVSSVDARVDAHGAQNGSSEQDAI